MKNSRIKWECNNWYKTEEELVQIINQSGNRILLNKKQSLIWDNINYQTYFEDLFKSISIQIKIDKKELEKVLKLFEKNKLISILDEDSIFGTIFG
ncbi:hypothetical protein [Anaerosalibacter massiliensis]|uniref:Uncharacterized protein n=1 Tax=Anaerosalibacter massiliensis TaxID=1347392 RepID=A0A9X2MK12_9FIRM|nr:hypothetical protein [Anaerosalibacter massiliensis]MCR2044592.1 hypothetical protein [Anaerosalibacter massiliensis]